MAIPFDELSPWQKIHKSLFQDYPPNPQEAIRSLRQSMTNVGWEIVYNNMLALIDRNKFDFPPERDEEIASACQIVLDAIETHDQRN